MAHGLDENFVETEDPPVSIEPTKLNLVRPTEYEELCKKLENESLVFCKNTTLVKLAKKLDFKVYRNAAFDIILAYIHMQNWSIPHRPISLDEFNILTRNREKIFGHDLKKKDNVISVLMAHVNHVAIKAWDPFQHSFGISKFVMIFDTEAKRELHNLNLVGRCIPPNFLYLFRQVLCQNKEDGQ
ncbi:MAG: hypothetical protein HYT63_00830 [Candidatus Yanofskybacteria bacterium]|nr:hypothetical protein [Candidatus Yanofskybacteria bacterium]